MRPALPAQLLLGLLGGVQSGLVAAAAIRWARSFHTLCEPPSWVRPWVYPGHPLRLALVAAFFLPWLVAVSWVPFLAQEPLGWRASQGEQQQPPRHNAPLIMTTR